MVKATANEVQNGEMNGKPDQFRLMELHSPKKRNISSDLFQSKTDKDEEIDRAKRQEQTTAEAIKKGRRFNPLEAIGNVAQQPIQLAMKQAMNKLFATYSDTSKPFGPTHDTTWGAPPPPEANRRANDEEIRMSTMVQPPAGQPGYYNYETQRKPAFYGNQLPALPYQTNNYDNQISGRMSAFPGKPPGFFPYNPYQQQSLNYQQHLGSFQQNRRAGADDHIENKIKEVLKKSPEEIRNLIAQIMSQKNKGGDNASMRKGFMGDMYDRSSEEKSSGEMLSNTQVEFNGPQGDAMIGNRRFTGAEDPQDIQGLVHKLTASTYNGLCVIFGYLQAVLETGNMQQIGERFVQFYEVLKHLKEYFD